jgi:hypothetical protein
MTRSLISASFVAILVTVGCGGGSPSAPSGAGGATITGTVVRGGTGTASAGGTPTTNVSVAGTPIASPVDTFGDFRLDGVPTGDIQLVFSGSGSGPGSAPSVSLSNVMDRETIDLRVAIAGGRATVQSEVRGHGTGKLVLCHREGNGGYHPVDVSLNAEPAHRAHGDATPGEPVPADPTKVFDAACALISPVDSGGTGPDVGPDVEDSGGRQKVQLCHRTGNGQYHSISVSISAERAHRGHGDGMVGEAVPGSSGRVFTASCGVQ